jgi:predicted CXXCH cytochrome family protein
VIAALLLTLAAAAAQETPPASLQANPSAAGPEAARTVRSGGLCTLCHPEARVEFERSIHSSEEVSCVSCHGGDPTASDVGRAHSKDFKGRIHRRDVPDLCASCHADAQRMRAYNLPTDQLALYRTSGHGRRLAAGNEKVAVCIDCHGVHDIRRTRDPASSVFVLNIPRTCGRCHARGGPGQAGRPGEDPFNDFAGSVHGVALLTHGNLSAPDCSRCHGAHGAAPPGLGDVDKVCGQCHETTREYFREGPHDTALQEAGLPECASCHSNHAINHPDVTRIDEMCKGCHDAGTPQVELALQMKTLHQAASQDLDEARRVVDEAAAIPLYVEDYRARLQEGQSALIESLPVMHSMDIKRVETLTRRARAMGEEVRSEVGGKLRERSWRRVGLAIFWFYLLLTIGILVMYRNRAARRERS